MLGKTQTSTSLYWTRRHAPNSSIRPTNLDEVLATLTELPSTLCMTLTPIPRFLPALFTLVQRSDASGHSCFLGKCIGFGLVQDPGKDNTFLRLVDRVQFKMYSSARSSNVTEYFPQFASLATRAIAARPASRNPCNALQAPPDTMLSLANLTPSL